MSHKALCLSCHLEVRPRQEAVSCDTCEGWNHRTCGTGNLFLITAHYFIIVVSSIGHIVNSKKIFDIFFFLGGEEVIICLCLLYIDTSCYM